jgi:thiamine-monophosphate kinase
VGTRIDSEEALIARFLAPLAEGFAGGLGLRDDCAVLSPVAGEDLVLTVDAVAEGVHFLSSDAPEDIAWKALAVNVSDLAAKGARPIVYLMSISFPAAPEADWMLRFTDGLRAAQQAFGIVLAGGDTDRRPGPLSVTITAIGSVPAGRMVQRTTARAGDLIFLSGTLGDGALGLELARDDTLHANWGLTESEGRHLLHRYRRPEPRLRLREALLSCASAAMDVSDGLAKDLGSMCRASGVGARIDGTRLPLHSAARKALAADAGILGRLISGGDDYEILAAVPASRIADFRACAVAAGITVTDLGVFDTEPVLQFRAPEGTIMALESGGWDHFGPR